VLRRGEVGLVRGGEGCGGFGCGGGLLLGGGGLEAAGLGVVFEEAEAEAGGGVACSFSPPCAFALSAF